MATLTFGQESQKFTYVDGDYTLTGSKVTDDGTMTAVDSGKVVKSDSALGNFYIKFGETFTYNVSLSQESEWSAVNTKVIALIAALRAAEQ